MTSHTSTQNRTSLSHDPLFRTPLSIVCLTLFLLLSAVHVVAQQDRHVVVEPEDTGEALVNPDMGWVLYFYSNVPKNYGSKLAPHDTVEEFPGVSTVYLRVPWAYLEPEDDQYNWELLDTPAQRWIARGKKVAFRITCSEGWMRFATPEWVKEKGAEGTFFNVREGPSPDGKGWAPNFDDPVFLRELDDFLEAMGKRYNGNPNVAFVDIGTFGLWGEGHTHMSSQFPEEKKKETVRRHLDMHLKHFPDTQLALNDDVIGHSRTGTDIPLMNYARENGVTFRDDSILVQPPPNQWYHDALARQFAPNLPVVVEHDHYGHSKQRGAWGDGSRLLEAVEKYRASEPVART